MWGEEKKRITSNCDTIKHAYGVLDADGVGTQRALLLHHKYEAPAVAAPAFQELLHVIIRAKYETDSEAQTPPAA